MSVASSSISIPPCSPSALALKNPELKVTVEALTICISSAPPGVVSVMVIAPPRSMSARSPAPCGKLGFALISLILSQLVLSGPGGFRTPAFQSEPSRPFQR
jgi:hypothetical protein